MERIKRILDLLGNPLVLIGLVVLLFCLIVSTIFLVDAAAVKAWFQRPVAEMKIADVLIIVFLVSLFFDWRGK